MNTVELEGKTPEELRDIAKKLNIKPHHKAKPETIIKQILAQPVAFQHDAMKHVAEQKAPEVFHNTPDEVLAAIKPYLKEGFEAKFLDDGTWLFRYKGREESGNMSIPIRVIRNKAENVARGALKLKMMNFDGELIIAG